MRLQRWCPLSLARARARSLVLLCRTPYHLAARAGRTEVLKVLMEDRSPAEREQRANATDFYGITPVFLALQKYAWLREAIVGLCIEAHGHMAHAWR